MFDTLILLTDKYAIWLVLLIALCKILHIVIYKGVKISYIFNTFFILFSGVDLTGSKNYPQRYRFRSIHNVLTILFYALLLTWLIIHIVLKQV
jgi:hypothetical protein